MNKRYKEIQNYIESNNGYKLLSKKYKNNKTKLEIQCPIGHIFYMAFNAFQRGQRCPTCANINRSKKRTNSYNYVKNYIESYGYKLLSKEYKSNTDKLVLKCPEGHIFKKTFNMFQRGQRCTICWELNRGKNKLYSYNYVKNYIESYGYNLLSEYYEKSSEKLIIKCPKGHIYDVKFNSFQQGCRCPICANVKKTKQPHKRTYDYIKNYIESYGYKLLSKEYKNNQTKLEIQCPKGHIFEKSFKRFRAGERCYKCSGSQVQKEVYDFIDSMYDGDIIENDRKLIYPKELDIFLPDYNLAIEFNGLYWHSESRLNDKKYHLNKTLECNKNNVQLIHIFEHEWLNKKDILKSIILSKIGFNKRIYARKCHIKEIDAKIKNRFLEENHLQGKDHSLIKLGLYHNNDLVSVMTFGKTRYNKNYEWEMIRFCNKKYYNIIGGAGKLLKYFIKKYKPSSIISYADIRYSNGKLYEKLGFNYLYNSDPNYFYYKNKTILTRIQCQKHKLKKLLGNEFNENKTEVQNMIDNGWQQIFDCGNMVYLWKNEDKNE